MGGADPRLVPGAGRGRLPARQDRRHAARGRDRGRAAADPLRLPVPGRARLPRHPLHGADRVGRDPRVAAPAARDLGARAAVAGGHAAPRGVVPGGDVLVLGGVEGDLARALHLRRAGRERAAGVVHGRLRGHGRPDVLAQLHVGLGGGSRPPAPALRAARRDPGVLPEPRQAAGLPGRRRGRRVRDCDLAAADADAARPAGRRAGHVHRHRLRRRVGDRALPGRPGAGADGAGGGRGRRLDDAAAGQAAHGLDGRRGADRRARRGLHRHAPELLALRQRAALPRPGAQRPDRGPQRPEGQGRAALRAPNRP